MTGEFALAVHALVYLNHRAATLSSEVLADNICTNPARVRKVMAQLKRAGLVATREGAEGGYSFDLPAGEVTLFQVAQAVDAVFVAASWRPGSVDKECLVSSGMGPLLDGLYGELDELCKQKISGITIADIDRKIFPAKE